MKRHEINPFEAPLPYSTKIGPSGLTRIQLHMMQQRIPASVMSELTQIPKPVLSMYAYGRRPISRRHLALLAVALNVPGPRLVGWADETEVFVVENEWNDTNPFYYRRRYTTRSRTMDPNDPIVHHSYPHNAGTHKYEMA